MSEFYDGQSNDFDQRESMVNMGLNNQVQSINKKLKMAHPSALDGKMLAGESVHASQQQKRKKRERRVSELNISMDMGISAPHKANRGSQQF